MSRLLRMALESDVADGNVTDEIEYEFIGRLVDLSILEHAASCEAQEQWEIKIAHTEANAGKGTMRVRKIQKAISEAPEYVFTTKTVFNDEGDRKETNVPTSEDQFKQFQIMAPQGMLKDRYFFPVADSGLVWHLDMHYVRGSRAGDRKYVQWVRLELEVPDRNMALPPFPVQLEDMITNQRGKRTPEEIAKLDMLFEHEFLTPNIYKLK